MHKITIFSMGTRGDVQPYIFLSKALIKHGYDVSLGSHPCWKNLVEESGVHFLPIGPDVDMEKEAAVIRGKNPNPALSMMKTMKFVFRIIQGSSEEIYEACKGNDLIVVSHSQMGLVEAGVLGIPMVNVILHKEMIGEPLKPKSVFEKLFGGIIANEMAKPYNKIRKKYGLKPVKSLEALMSENLILLPLSQYVVKESPYWMGKIVLTGYWYDNEEDYVPDEKLANFLSAGEKPVLLALGAMSFEDTSEKDRLDMFVNALKKTGCRVIIQGFKKTLLNYELPETMISCGAIPYSWLFSKCKFVIHHSGFGTSASTMIYGIPSIPVPHILDQLGFAMQLTDINIATKPLTAKDLSEQRIIEAIEEMNLSYDEKKEKAVYISEKLQSENGLETAVKLIGDEISRVSCSTN